MGNQLDKLELKSHGTCCFISTSTEKLQTQANYRERIMMADELVERGLTRAAAARLLRLTDY